MPAQERVSPGQMFQIYGMVWVTFFVLAIINAVCCSIFKVPIAQAVNVQLAAALAGDILLIGIYLILFALLLVTLQIKQALLILLLAFLFTFLSLAPIAGFQIWAMFFKIDLMSESFMYAMVLDKMRSVAEAGLGMVGGVLGDSRFEQAWPFIQNTVTTLSGVIAIVSFFQRKPARAG